MWDPGPHSVLPESNQCRLHQHRRASLWNSAFHLSAPGASSNGIALPDSARREMARFRYSSSGQLRHHACANPGRPILYKRNRAYGFINLKRCPVGAAHRRPFPDSSPGRGTPRGASAAPRQRRQSPPVHHCAGHAQRGRDGNLIMQRIHGRRHAAPPLPVRGKNTWNSAETERKSAAIQSWRRYFTIDWIPHRHRYTSAWMAIWRMNGITA